MQLATFLTSLLPLLAIAVAEEVKTDYTLEHTCKRPTKRGDTIRVHYHGSLADSGKKFDASYDRNDPLRFTVGQGQVISGWDNGLLDMCPGDKRKLTIPPEHGYGQRNMGPIPGGSTLIFDTELVEIVGADPEERVVKTSDTKAAPPPESAEEDGKKQKAEGQKENDAKKDEL